MILSQLKYPGRMVAKPYWDLITILIYFQTCLNLFNNILTDSKSFKCVTIFLFWEMKLLRVKKWAFEILPNYYLISVWFFLILFKIYHLHKFTGQNGMRSPRILVTDDFFLNTIFKWLYLGKFFFYMFVSSLF